MDFLSDFGVVLGSFFNLTGRNRISFSFVKCFFGILLVGKQVYFGIVE